MRTFAYTRPDGGLSIMRPVRSMEDADEAILAAQAAWDKTWGRFVMPDGSMALPAGENPPPRPTLLTDEQIEDRALAALPADVTAHEIAEAAIPTDRTFRDAWAHSDGKIAVDMPKARDIHRNRLRAARKPMLDALDRDYMRADEDSDVKRKKAIAAQKQRLRDAPADPRIEAATTPDELKAVDPLN